jgi:hypothetical protein
VVEESSRQLVCPLCGAHVPAEFPDCRALFDAVCARDDSDSAFAALHLFTVDAYALQHSEEHGPRSNAFHRMGLCRLLEYGDNPALGQRHPRRALKAFEALYRNYPRLEPPRQRGALTIVDVYGAGDPEEYAIRVRQWAGSVWDAYRPHHAWAHQAATLGWRP